MSDQALTVSGIEIQRSADSGKMHQFTCKLNGVTIRDLKFFPEKGNLMPPAREYISRKTNKRAYWYHVVLTEDQQSAIIKAFKKKLKAVDDEDDD